MKKIFATYLLIFLAFLAHAQQELQVSQFMINPQLLNPAYSSVNDNVSWMAGYRTQWTQVEGSPNTSFTSINGPINKSRWAATHPGDFHNWHGAGITFINDQIGPYNTTKFNANYSYNIKLKEGRKFGYQHMDGLRLSLGATAGINNYRVDKDILGKAKLLGASQINHYPSLQDKTLGDLREINSSAFDMSLGGILYYDNTYFLGFSTTQLFQNDIGLSKDITLARHYFVMMTYKWLVGDDYYIIPSMIMKMVKGAPISVDFTTRLDWQDKVYFGLGYRPNDAILGMLGVHLKWGEKIKHFRVDKHRYMMDVYYSYDYTTSRLGKARLEQNSRGSHEITLAFFLPPMFYERNAEDTWK
jgi:type IX secretion system PorP/SprF family membrane protein